MLGVDGRHGVGGQLFFRARRLLGACQLFGVGDLDRGDLRRTSLSGDVVACAEAANERGDQEQQAQRDAHQERIHGAFSGTVTFGAQRKP